MAEEMSLCKVTSSQTWRRHKKQIAPAGKILKTIPSKIFSKFSPSLATENLFYWHLGNKEKPNNSQNHLCMSLRLIED